MSEEAGVQMTPEQWRDFFLARTPEEQLVVAGQVLENSDTAMACFRESHRPTIAHQQATLQALVAIHEGVADVLDRAAHALDSEGIAGSLADELTELAKTFREAAGE